MFNSMSKDKLRLGSEILASLLFLVLLQRKALQSWILIFGLGVVSSIVFGRLYCAWICPMGTLFRPIEWLFKKLMIKRLAIPNVLKKPWIRWVFVILFIGTMVLSRRVGLRINPLLYIVLASVVVTLFFEEALWHRVICPYGTLLRIFSKPALFGLSIQEQLCISCGRCQKQCPNSAIDTLDTTKRRIDKQECLTCFRCQDACPVQAIHYDNRSDSKGSRLSV